MESNMTVDFPIVQEGKTAKDYVKDVIDILISDEMSVGVCRNTDNALAACEVVKILRGSGIVITQSDIKDVLCDIARNYLSLKGVHSPFNMISFAGSYCRSIGEVIYDNHLGSDKTIAYCAKESYGKADDLRRRNTNESLGEYLPEDISSVYQVLHRLSRNEHSSPFEQVNLSVKLKMPIFVMRQWVRHRTARLNEISARYTKLKPDMYVPDRDRILSSVNDKYKQLDDPDVICDEVWKIIGDSQDQCYAAYEKLLGYFPPELARIVLPVSMSTELYWNCDLNNLQKMLMLRLDSHAQYEIRQIANSLFRIAFGAYPITMGLFFWNRFLPKQISKSAYDSLYSYKM
jgi:thymidylate synthase (FAD)